MSRVPKGSELKVERSGGRVVDENEEARFLRIEVEDPYRTEALGLLRRDTIGVYETIVRQGESTVDLSGPKQSKEEGNRDRSEENSSPVGRGKLVMIRLWTHSGRFR